MFRIVTVCFLLIVLSVPSGAAYATKGAYSPAASTGTVRNPSMTIQGGSWGTSTISLNDLATVTMSSSASSIYFIPVTLTNSQSSPTANPLQVKVSWNPSTYSSYEAANLGNLRFCADSACNTLLYAWLESCTTSCSTSATTASAWVKLTSSIGANGGTVTIYLAFLAKSGTFDGSYWGEAPYLSGTYGQYDNGANVFNFYDSFAGTSLSAKWTSIVSASGAAIAVNNGLTVTTTTTAGYGFVMSASQASPEVAEAYTTSGNPILGVSTSQTLNGFIAPYYGYSMDWYAGHDDIEYEGTGHTQLANLVEGTFPAGVWQVTWSATGAEYFLDGSGVSYQGTNAGSAIANYGIYVGQSNGVTGSSVFSWARMRSYPPNGVMPSFSLGPMTSSPFVYVPITLTNGQTSATPAPFQEPITFTPSQYSRYEAADLGNIRFCADSRCGTMMYSWLESCTPSCSSGASTATVWVLLNSPIAGSGGTLTIYMAFFPTGTGFDGVLAGEAPGLSPSYAQYDNGANVFIEYNNGNALFASSHTGSGGTGPSITTTAPTPFGHAITGSVSGGTAAASTWTTNGNTGSPALPSSYIAQMLVQLTGSTPLVDLLTNVGSITTGPFYVFRFDARSGYQDLVGYYPSGASTTTIISSSAVTSSTSTWYQLTAVNAADRLSLYKASAGSATNFGTLGTLEISSASGQGYSGGGIAVTTDGATSTDYFTMILVRAYPPGNVVPSAAFGSVFPSTSGVILTLTNTGSTSLLANMQLYSSTNAGRIYNLTLSFQGPYSKQVVLGTGVTNQNSGSQVTVAGSTTVQILVGAAVSSAGTSTVTIGLKIQRPPATGQTSVYCFDIIGLTVN